MANPDILVEKHSLLNETKFRFKSSLLIARRMFGNLFSGIKKSATNAQFHEFPLLAVSESELWNKDDNDANWILTAGKVQNLRLAARCLDGIVIEAGEIFSFWKHIGKPGRLKGYVTGRELREGCIIPTVAGGLCQLSNALYDAALKAGFGIIERHRHTKVIKGSLAEQDRDATVKWNYIDLRFRSAQTFRIEVDITEAELIVRFRGTGAGEMNGQTSHRAPVKLNDCYSCGNYDCARHPGEKNIHQDKAITCFLLDEKWEEYDVYLRELAGAADAFILPMKKNRFIKTNRYSWTTHKSKTKQVFFASLKRALLLRFLPAKGNNVFSQQLAYDRNIARAMAKKIPLTCTHLVVSQNLLPFLWETGALGGRTFDVLMYRLPMELLHKRLDEAYAIYPASPTLKDFRAPQTIIDLENRALTRSNKIITPHAGIAGIFHNKSIQLNWILPTNVKQSQEGNNILFPASALGRKGAYEMKRLADEMNLSLVITGKATETENFWGTIKTVRAAENIFAGIGLVIYPAYVEHRPRLLLKALAMGLPVICTKACGLPPMDNLTIIPTGDYEALKEAVRTRI